MNNGLIFNDVYRMLLRQLYFNPHFTCKPRGQEVKELIDVCFTINPLYPLMKCDERQTPMHYNAAELIWYYSGNDSVDFIGKYANLWKQICNDDGTCNSAYGNLIFKKQNTKDGRTQWEWAKQQLISDVDTRQAILHYNTPEHQYEGVKDFVCTLYNWFFIRNNKLHLHYCLRSQDVIFGTPMDVVWGCTLLTKMHHELKQHYPTLELGNYTHQCLSFHLYQRHYELVKKMLHGSWETNLANLSFPVWDGDITDEVVEFEKDNTKPFNTVTSKFWQHVCRNLLTRTSPSGPLQSS